MRPKTDSKARQEEEQKAKHDLKIFLSDPSPIIGNAFQSLTDCRFVNLACEDAYSKLVQVVTIANDLLSR